MGRRLRDLLFLLPFSCSGVGIAVSTLLRFMRRLSPFTIVPAVLLLAFSLYNLISFLGTNSIESLRGPIKQEGGERSLHGGPPSETRLAASAITAYEEEIEVVKQENRALYQSLSTVEDRLRKFLSTITTTTTTAASKEDTSERGAEAPSHSRVASDGGSSGRRKLPSSYTFWSSDFHISPIADLKDLFQPMGMKIIDKSLSGHCHLKNTCASDLRVLSKGNGIDLGQCPNQLRRDFFEAYKDDPQMKTVDAFLCNHACGLCEVFMPFNKSLIVIASTRYEIGRHSPSRWSAWNDNLKKIAANPRNVVAANNLYDAEYIKYFTGLEHVPVIPNYCGYTEVTYSNPRRPQILVGPGRGIHEGLFRELKSRGQSSGLDFARIRDLYPHFEYSDLVQHKAIVLIPYQVSIMSIFEYYRMAIPMFVPSPSLLAHWQLQHRVMDERTWDGVFGHPRDRSAIGPSSHTTTTPPPYDPNNEMDEAAIKHWISYADFYVWPHIITFTSWDDLIDKLQSTDLPAQSSLIKAHNERMKEELKLQWYGIFDRIFDGLPPLAQVPRDDQVMDFDASMKALYSVKVHGACNGDTHLPTTTS